MIIREKPEAATSGFRLELPQLPEAQRPPLFFNASSGCLQDWNDAHSFIVHPVPLVPFNLLCLSELLAGTSLLL
jgi:hypothetical protein